MNKKSIAIAALAVAGMASAASAQTVSFQSTANNPGSFSGGEFEATFSNGDESRRVFCLERQITFSPGTQYNYTFDNGAGAIELHRLG